MWCKICGIRANIWTDVAESNVNSANGFAFFKKSLLLNSNTK